jgi:hypothetical protein
MKYNTDFYVIISQEKICEKITLIFSNSAFSLFFK